MHISEQQHCVFLPDGSSMVDYIGTTETLESDWAAVRSLFTTACYFALLHTDLETLREPLCVQPRRSMQ